MEELSHNIAVMVLIHVLVIGLILWMCKTMNVTLIPKNLHHKKTNQKMLDNQFKWKT